MKLNCRVPTLIFAWLLTAVVEAQVPTSVAGRYDAEEPIELETIDEELIAPGEVLYGIGPSSTRSGTELFRIEEPTSSPRALRVGATGSDMVDVGIDPTTGRIYAIDDTGAFFELDRSTGAGRRIDSTGFANLNALEFDRSGQAWSFGFLGNLYRIDKQTGRTTLVGRTGFHSGGDLAFDVDGRLFATTDNALIQLNRTTGTGTLVGPLGFGGAFGLEIDASGEMYVGRASAGFQPAELHRANKATGATVLIGRLGSSSRGSFDLFGLSFTPPAVTEPPPPGSAPIRSRDYPGFLFWVRISGNRIGTQVFDCVPETVCVAGAIADRSEVLLRIVGPKSNGFLWANIVKFNTTATEIWIREEATGRTRYYALPALAQDSDVLPGLVDKTAFLP